MGETLEDIVLNAHKNDEQAGLSVTPVDFS